MKRVVDQVMDIYFGAVASGVVNLFKLKEGVVTDEELLNIVTASGAAPIFSRLMQGVQTEIYMETGKKAFDIARKMALGQRRIRKQDPLVEASFSIWTQDFSEFLNTRAAESVTGMNEQTTKALREVIGSAVFANKPMNHVAPRVREIVGLNAQQGIWATNYRQKLMEQAEKGTINPKRIDGMTSRYVKRLHQLRASTISRTEVARVVSFGTLSGYKQTFVTQVQWVASAGACSVCAQYDRQIFEIDEVPIIPVHPNGRCSYAPVPESIQFPDEVFT